MPSDRPLTFDIPLSDFDLGLLPPSARTIGSDAFDDAVLMYFMGQYADKGINAAVSVDSRAIHVTLIPEHPRSLLDHAAALMREGKLADGIDILEWLRENTGPDADVLYNLGIARSERGQFPEAIEVLTACTALDAGYVDAWTGLGVAYQRLDRPDQAEAALRKAIALNPGSGFAHRNLARFCWPPSAPRRRYRICGRLRTSFPTIPAYSTGSRKACSRPAMRPCKRSAATC